MIFKKISIVLVFISFCGGNSSSITSETTTTLFSGITTTIQLQNNIEDIDVSLAMQNFEEFWLTKLKEDRPLSEEEIKVTLELNNLMSSKFDYLTLEGTQPFFYIGDLKCGEKIRGTLALGFIDENHPIKLSIKDVYGPELMWGSCYKDEQFVTPVYGWPFFQDGEWWAFINTDKYTNILEECRKVYENCIVPGTGGINSRVKIVIPDIYLDK